MSTPEAIEVTEFGKRVAAEREARGWKLAYLAGMTGVTEKTIWRWERGETTNVRLDDAAAVARALGVSLDYLAGHEGATA